MRRGKRVKMFFSHTCEDFSHHVVGEIHSKQSERIELCNVEDERKDERHEKIKKLEFEAFSHKHVAYFHIVLLTNNLSVQHYRSGKC